MNLPSFAELPIRPELPAGSAWGIWGDSDRLGCLNLLGPERVLRGRDCVRTGVTFGLNLEMELPSPPLFGRPAFEHEVVGRPSGVSKDDLLHGLNTQSSSQWDGFRHVRSAVHGAYNGLPEDQHGVDHWAKRGIVGRGLLADVARWRAAVGRPVSPGTTDTITADDLHATLAAQGTPVETGDILLVRTGWLSWYRTLDSDARATYAVNTTAIGFEPSIGTAAALWDLHIACLGVDNPAVEAWPPPLMTMTPEQRMSAMTDSGDPAVAAQAFMHLVLLPLFGLPLGELFDLDALADHCDAQRTYDFLVTSAPLNLANGVATPPNIVAIC